MHAIPPIVSFIVGVSLVWSCALASQSPQPDAEINPMLRCARMRDVALQIRCFDEAKRGPRANRTSSSNTRSEPLSANSVQSSVGVADESRHVDRYAEEIARQLGKEMYLEEYPRRAREEGRGGTTELLLHIDSNANLAGIRVWRSSGYSDLDQFALDKVAHLRLPRVPKAIRSPLFTVRLPITFAVRSSVR